jgi:peptide/nickel transport system ATP-binding protein
MTQPFLEARGVSRHFVSGSLLTGRAKLRAVEHVDLALAAGDGLGIVGESGCGKSTLGRVLIGLLAPSGGDMLLEGRPLPRTGTDAWYALRRTLQLVHQDPLAALNPRLRIGEQIAEPLEIHGVARDPARLREAAVETLATVGLEAGIADRLPHQLSGGQRQRVVIGRAMILKPRLVVFDEPVSALDASVQAQVLNLIRDLRDRLKLGYVFISHDLRVVRQVAERVAVMYLGRIVEAGDTASVFAAPRHPYTQALMSALPRTSPGARSDRIRLRGEPPSPLAPPSGCAFHPRCAHAVERCRREAPALSPDRDGRHVACHLHEPSAYAAAS